MIAKTHRWQLAALALASFMSFDSWAMSLGRLTVQSALGEPLRAEVDIASLAADEAASLKIKLAPIEAFKSAGLEFSPVLTGLQVELLKRADGSAYIKLGSERAINEPFVDLILEANWSSGRITRDYTMLFDPPSLRAPSPPQVSMPPVAAPVPVRTEPAPPPQVVPTIKPVEPTAPALAVQARKPTVPEKTAVPVAARQAAQVNVKAGDTAGKIAASSKPASVTLDQMLLAMLRTNPQAFIQGNVNRIKAGAVLDLPTEDQAVATEPAQATEIIQTQSRDFDAYRRKLADHVPAAAAANSARNISGKVQVAVEDKKPAAAAPDKLTLSKGSAPAREDELAKARAAQEAASRAAELTKNITELSKIAAATGASAAQAISSPVSSASATPASPPAVPASVPVAFVASAPELPASVSLAPKTAASKPLLPSSQPAPEVAQPESSFVDELIENPLLPVVAAGLLALLAGLAAVKIRQRKKAMSMDSSFLESRLQPESFFGVSGGQSVDTSENLATGSSMVYSPSQLDAVDDVDPVAEADVYLAYGRDIQAEEILKDALRTQPDRLAIHQKLLEIYAKRQDVKAFESFATLAFNLTNGSGAQWEKICESGLSIDPQNALYLPGGQPERIQAADKTGTHPASLAATSAQHLMTAPLPSISTDLDLDLDLDFSLDELEPMPAAQATRPMAAFPEIDAALPTLTAVSEPTPEPEAELTTQILHPEPTAAPSSADNSLDFSWTEPVKEEAAPEPTEPSLDDLDFDVPVPEPEPKALASAGESGMLEFDLGSLSLDLGEESSTQSGALENELAGADPLVTKLALAEEFKAIGDDDGARALIEEVIAEASGDMKSKAQRALSNL